MLTRVAVVLSALFVITACTDKGQEPESTVSAPATTPAAAASVTAPTSSLATPITTATEAAAAVPATVTGTLAPPAGMPAGPAPVLGTDYFIIDTPEAESGKTISVVEVFNYRCPHCAHFQPTVDAWLQKLPTDVTFSYLPAAFGGPWDDFVLAYYAADVMGVRARSHSEIFKAIHEDHSYTHDEIGAVYAKYGVDPKVFVSTMESFAIKAKLSQARAQIQTWGVDSIPTIVVAGKYRVIGTPAGGEEGLLRSVDWLIAKERAERKAH